MKYSVFIGFFIAFFAIQTNMGFAQDLTTSLIGYWSFETTIEANTQTSGILEQATLTEKGKVGKGLSLTEKKSGFKIDRGVDLFDNFSICFWLSPLQSNSNGVLFHQFNPKNGRFFKLRLEDNAFIFECRDEFGPKHYASSPKFAFKQGQYHFVSLTLKNDEIRLSCDIKELISSSDIAMNIREPQSNDKLSFGALNDKEDSFQGVFDEWLFFNRAISKDELTKIYNGWWTPMTKEVTHDDTPPTVNGRESVIIGKPIDVETDSVTIEYFDRDQVDNDTISIYLNNILVVEKQRVDKSKKRVKIPILPEKENYLSVYAENVGRVPPNTASVRVYAGKEKYDIVINSDFVQNGTIQFRYKPKALKN